MNELISTTGQRVSLTTDIQMSIQNMAYKCIITHKIDSEQTLYKQIIVFKQIENRKGASIKVKLEYCMKDWRIRKLLCITVDNANINDTAIKWLR